MNALIRAAEETSRVLWSLSWQVGVLVLLVWVISVIFRKASPNFRYWLWCAVLLRLCIPVALVLPWGVSGEMRHTLEVSAPRVLKAVQQPVPSLRGSPENTEPASSSVQEPAHPEMEPGIVREEALGLSLAGKLGLAWMCVSISLLTAILLRSLRACQLLRTLPEVKRPELLELVGSLRSKCAIRRSVRILKFPAGHAAYGPAAVGVLHPTILLPEQVVEQWDLHEIEPVLLHEFAHIKRWDLLFNWVQMLIQAVYFFHPLVWLANSKIRQEREMVCDDLAILLLSGQSKRYSRSFVRVLEEGSHDRPLFQLAGVGMTEYRKPLARRIIRMMGSNYRLHRPLGWLSILLLVAVSAGAIAVAAERAAEKSQPQSEVDVQGNVRAKGNASVSGRIVDAETGEPLTGGSLMLVRMETADVIVLKPADDGTFEFSAVPGGSYMLRVNTAPAGYTTSSPDATWAWARFDLKDDEQKRDVILKLPRGFSISGRVTREDGSPFPMDKTCTVIAWVNEGSGKRYLPMADGNLNAADGSYHIDGLDGRPVYVQFVDTRSEQKDDPYPPVYFPGTFSRDKATKITFDEKGEREIKNINIPLNKTGGLVLEGTVTSRDSGKPLSKALVVIAHADTMFDRATTYTDEQGRYRFECLGSGEFQVYYDATPQEYVRSRKRISMVDGAPPITLDATLEPGARISGTLKQEDGTPWHLPRFKRMGYVQLRNFSPQEEQYGPWNRFLEGGTEFLGNSFLGGEGDCEKAVMRFPDDASFVVDGVIPGQVTISFSPMVEGKEVARIDYAGKDILRDGLTIEPGQKVEGIELVIGSSTEATLDEAREKKDDAVLRAHCTNNLKQMDVLFKMFVNEERSGTFPALSSTPGQLMFFSEEKAHGQVGVYPEYLTDTKVLVCPASADAAKLDTSEIKDDPKLLINDHSYVYLGFAVTSDAEMKAFAEEYRSHLAKGEPPLEDLPVAEGKGSGGGNVLYRLRWGIERKIAKNGTTDAEIAKITTQIPVLIERPGHHKEGGGNVLYLDGSVLWVASGTWPMTQATNDALAEIAPMSGGVAQSSKSSILVRHPVIE